jgi:polyvinyl alcohol dehydrogenase (cytochrome)
MLKATRNMLVVGQKTGNLYGLDATTGTLIWTTVIGPGSFAGGIMFGSASDGVYAYVANANYANEEYHLIDGQNITWGAYSAVNLTTGEIVWQTPTVDFGPAYGPVTVANGVVFGTDEYGGVYGLDATNGNVLYAHNFGQVIGGGVSVVDGHVYLPIGYEGVTIGQLVALGIGQK